ncbi:MAG TPA: hypothetical protein VMV69_27315 [Pirellulales bacterium]|nr:hypothetical protein [Pirellulales bacterium]
MTERFFSEIRDVGRAQPKKAKQRTTDRSDNADSTDQVRKEE